MKKILKYISIALVIPVLATSCLKDDTLIGPDAPNAITNVIEFKNPAPIISGTSSKLPLYNLAFNVVPSTELVLEVNYAGAEVAPEDIHVKVKVDNALVDQYASDFNKLNPDDEMEPYAYLDPTWYTIPTFDVTIKKGEKTGRFIVNLKPDQFSFDDSYALGFSIESSTVGNVSNFGKIVIAIAAKNSLDGAYKYTGSLVDVVSPAFVHGSTKRTYTMELHTMGPDEVAMFDPYVWGDYLYPFNTGTGWSGYGSFCPVFKFDLQTNKIIAVRNLFGQPAANTRSAEIDPSGINTYDPVTKTIKVSYFMKQPSAVSASPNIRAKITEVFVYSGARD